MLRIAMMMAAIAMMTVVPETSAVAQSKKKMNEDQIRSGVVDHTLYYRYIRTNHNLAAVYFKPDGTYKFFCCEETGWRFETQGPWKIENDRMCTGILTGERAGQTVCRTYYKGDGTMFADDIRFEKVVKGEE